MLLRKSEIQNLKGILCDDDPRIIELVKKIFPGIICFSDVRSAIQFLETSNGIHFAVFDINYSISSKRFYQLSQDDHQKILQIFEKKGVEYFYTSAARRSSADFPLLKNRFIPKCKLEEWFKNL